MTFCDRKRACEANRQLLAQLIKSHFCVKMPSMLCSIFNAYYKWYIDQLKHSGIGFLDRNYNGELRYQATKFQCSTVPSFKGSSGWQLAEAKVIQNSRQIRLNCKASMDHKPLLDKRGIRCGLTYLMSHHSLLNRFVNSSSPIQLKVH